MTEAISSTAVCRTAASEGLGASTGTGVNPSGRL